MNEINNNINRFSLKEKLKQKSVWPFVERYLDEEYAAPPLVVDFDLTTFCDLACPECISSPVLNTERFSGKSALSLVDELIELGIKAVILIGGGEPLIHKSVSHVIRRFGEAGVKIGLVTNGTLIHKHIDAIAEHVSWTRLSIDAGTTETYHKFRPSKKGASLFDTVIENARQLGEVKKHDMGYSFLLMSRSNGETNHLEIEQAGRLAKEVGCDYFELKTMFNLDHKILPQDQEIVDSAKSQIAALRKIEDDRFRIYDAFTFKELAKGEGSGLGHLKDYEACPVAHLRTTITPHGVYPCAYHRNNKNMRIGCLKKASMREVWENKKPHVNPMVDCQFECARHEMNLFLFDLKSTRENVHLVDDWDLFI